MEAGTPVAGGGPLGTLEERPSGDVTADPAKTPAPEGAQPPAGSAGQTGTTAAGKSTTVGPLLTYVKYYVAKADNFWALLLFSLACCLTGTALLAFAQPEVAHDLALAIGAREMMAADFVAVNSPAGWYSWLEGVVQRMHDRAVPLSGQAATNASRLGSSEEALVYGLTLELYRVRSVPCDENDDGVRDVLRVVDPRRFASGNEPDCYPQYSAKDAAMLKPAASGNQTATPVVHAAAAFVEGDDGDSGLREGVNANNCGWAPTRGRYATYDCQHSSARLFIDAMDINGDAARFANVTAALAELRAHRWLDRSDARAAVATGIFYHRKSRLFYRYTTLFESGDAGGGSTFRSAWSFPLLNIGSTGRDARGIAAFALDCGIVGVGLLTVYHALWRFAMNLELNSRVSNAIELSFALDAFVVGLITAYSYLRFSMWRFVAESFPPAPGDTRAAAVGSLHAVAGRHETAAFVGSWMMLACVFRFTYSLRYVSRVSLVFETVAASATDLVSTVLLSMTVVMAYALAGIALWYPQQTPFRSLGRAVLQLFNFMLSVDAGTDLYTELERTHPVVTTVFFVTLFLISWCVLMNVLVGVLATAFAAAAATQVVVRRPVWTVDSVARDFVSLVRRLRDTADGRPHPLIDETGAAVAAPPGFAMMSLAGDGNFALGPYAEREVNPLLKVVMCGRQPRPTTLRALHLIDKLRVIKRRHGPDALLTVEDVAAVSLFDPAVTLRMVTKAELHVGVSDANRRRWLIMQKLIRVEKDVSAQLSVQYRQLQELTETLCGAELGAELQDESESDDDADGMSEHAPDAAWSDDEYAASDAGPVADAGAAADGDSLAGHSQHCSDAAASDGGWGSEGSAEGDFEVPDEDEDTARNVADLEASVRRRRRAQRQQQRRAFHTTMVEVQRLLQDVERVCHQAQTRRAALSSAVDVDALQQLCDEYERLALSLGVVIL